MTDLVSIPQIREYLMDGAIYQVLRELAETYDIDQERVDEFLDLTDAVIAGKLPISKMPAFLQKAFNLEEEQAKNLAVDLAGHRLLPLSDFLKGVESFITSHGGTVDAFSVEKIQREEHDARTIAKAILQSKGVELPPHLFQRFVYIIQAYVAKERAAEPTKKILMRPVNIGGLALPEEASTALLQEVDQKRDLLMPPLDTTHKEVKKAVEQEKARVTQQSDEEKYEQPVPAPMPQASFAKPVIVQEQAESVLPEVSEHETKMEEGEILQDSMPAFDALIEQIGDKSVDMSTDQEVTSVQSTPSHSAPEGATLGTAESDHSKPAEVTLGTAEPASSIPDESPSEDVEMVAETEEVTEEVAESGDAEESTGASEETEMIPIADSDHNVDDLEPNVVAEDHIVEQEGKKEDPEVDQVEQENGPKIDMPGFLTPDSHAVEDDDALHEEEESDEPLTLDSIVEDHAPEHTQAGHNNNLPALAVTHALAASVPVISGDIFDDEEKKEIEMHKKVLEKEGAGVTNPAISDAAIMETLSSLQVDGIQVNGLLGLAKMHMKGLREPRQTEALLRDRYGLSGDQGDLVMQTFDQIKQEYMDANTASDQITTGEIGMHMSEQDLLNKRHAAMTKHMTDESIDPVLPGARVSAARSKEEELAEQLQKIDPNALEEAQKNSRPEKAQAVVSKETTPATSMQQKVTDVQYKQKLIGPEQEIGSLTSIEFRRLSTDPAEAARKVLDKLSLLEAESYERRIAGVEAWRKSPVHQLYVAMTGEALAKGVSIQELAADRRTRGEESLSPAEITAIVQLNRKIRF